MRVPANSFDADDMALCRAHGDAASHDANIQALVRQLDPVRHAAVYRTACDDFEAGVHVPSDPPLPPSYWDDLERWLKTLAPAKHAGQPSAPAWRRGGDIPRSERVGLWHVRNDRYDKDPCPADHASGFFFQEAEYMPAAPGAKLGDPYDESKCSTAGPSADVWHSETPSVPGVYAIDYAHEPSKNKTGWCAWFDGQAWHSISVGQDSSAVLRARKLVAEPLSVVWLRLIEADEQAARLASTSGADGGK